MTKCAEVRRLALAAAARATRAAGVGGGGAAAAPAVEFGTSPRSLRRWKQQERATGSSAPLRHRRLKERVMPDSVFEHLRFIFLLEPTPLNQEATDELLAVANVLYTARQIRTACRVRGWTRKAITTAALERDEALRTAFRRVLASGDFTASNFVVLDESLAKGYDRLRSSKGMAPRGQRPVVRTLARTRTERASALVAINLSGIFALETIDTTEMSVDTNTFMAFLENCVLPKMNRFLNPDTPDSVLVLDNCRLHDRLRIFMACQARGILVLWLPAYSCDYSPIELVFNNAKRVLREKYGRNPGAARISLAEMFTDAIYTCLTPTQMCDTFGHCLLAATAAEREAIVGVV